MKKQIKYPETHSVYKDGNKIIEQCCYHNSRWLTARLMESLDKDNIKREQDENRDRK